MLAGKYKFGEGEMYSPPPGVKPCYEFLADFPPLPKFYKVEDYVREWIVADIGNFVPIREIYEHYSNLANEQGLLSYFFQDRGRVYVDDTFNTKMRKHLNVKTISANRNNISGKNGAQRGFKNFKIKDTCNVYDSINNLIIRKPGNRLLFSDLKEKISGLNSSIMSRFQKINPDFKAVRTSTTKKGKIVHYTYYPDWALIDDEE
jgi:hypothetical protein